MGLIYFWIAVLFAILIADQFVDEYDEVDQYVVHNMLWVTEYNWNVDYYKVFVLTGVNTKDTINFNFELNESDKYKYIKLDDSIYVRTEKSMFLKRIRHTLIKKDKLR